MLLGGLVAIVAVAALALVVLVAHPFGGGGGASPTPAIAAAGASSTPSPTTVPTVPAASAGPPVITPAGSDATTPAVTIEPTSGPSQPTVTATWASPVSGGTFDTWTLDLAADTALLTPDAGVLGVTFHVAWDGGSTTACEASRAGSSGTWKCSADLTQLGVPPGPLTLSFDVVDAAGSTTESAGGTLDVTYAAVPPKPASAKLETVSDMMSADGASETIVERVTWDAPEGYAKEFRLYAVKFCPNDSPSAKDGTPCLVEHTPLPPGKLELVKSVNGDARSMKIEHTIGAGICPNTLWCEDTYALVLGAYNDNGQSVFTIVKSTEICHTCVY